MFSRGLSFKRKILHRVSLMTGVFLRDILNGQGQRTVSSSVLFTSIVVLVFD